MNKKKTLLIPLFVIASIVYLNRYETYYNCFIVLTSISIYIGGAIQA